MNESHEHSVSLWIAKLKEGDQAAAGPLWNRYFERLVGVAGRRMGSASRRVADEEDVAVSVFDSLCRGAAAGNFQQLSDRDDLWKLLVAIAGQKAVDQIRRQMSQKRGGGEVRGDSIFAHPSDDGPQGFEQFLSATPTPEFLAVIDEQQTRLFSLLRDDVQRDIATLRLEGFANEEIAEKLGISIRTVERKFSLIRDAWGKELTAAG
ncbi:RNA polymerase sigma factor [Anatilimnocola aggregata]|uniref:RNA polymerase sigma factor n=1 Tax=Anatilimnocola aggregata TaxID=2528021 RepID=A0A517YFV9_9BACT|nr:ECF-type sigma factor [Anatilimnocola aggregata]QDU29108.1 RNA polymerase sigma factor [Anatilimnocola aggregata]